MAITIVAAEDDVYVNGDVNFDDDDDGHNDCDDDWYLCRVNVLSL